MTDDSPSIMPVTYSHAICHNAACTQYQIIKDMSGVPLFPGQQVLCGSCQAECTLTV